MTRDYYEILGVQKDAPLDEIKKAYRRLAMEYHPDRNPGNKEAEEKFKEAAEAYGILSDPEKRQRYDQFGHAGLGGSGGGFQFDPRQFADFEDILGSFFGGGGIFGDIFGFGSRRRAESGERGSDLQYTLRIPFKEAVFGVDAKEIEIPRQEACPECRGTGAASGTGPVVCPHCHGRGQVGVRQGFFQMFAPCPRCEGRGQVIPSPCPKCRGEALVHRKASIKFRIPAGVDRGTRLRLPGEGEGGRYGGPTGDLFVVFDVEPDPRYERHGDDLHQRLDAPWPLLTLGGDLELETLYGQDRIRLSAGTPADKVVKVPNAGVPRLRGGGRGDLYVHLRAAVPKDLSAVQKKAVRQVWDLLEGRVGEDGEPCEEGFLSRLFGSDDCGKKKKRKR